MRINELDYLRGFMALGIMFYHYFSWTYHPYESDTILGIIGIYGVSIFYICWIQVINATSWLNNNWVKIELSDLQFSNQKNTSLYNLMGQQIKVITAQNANGAERFSTKELPSGVYVITVSDEQGGQHTGKLAIK